MGTLIILSFVGIPAIAALLWFLTPSGRRWLHRSGLLWRLFMGHPDVRRGLEKLGFVVKEETED